MEVKRMLNVTKEKLYDRKALIINPAKICQPVGAIYSKKSEINAA
jgi:nitrogenase molybdenum-iron protein alpha/beta subunit